jgi:glycine/D-amino acid oxidase-like deaminating enzyme
MTDPRYELAIVGSGVTGLSTAYSLAKKGFTDIVILDMGHLACGASTRNGGGIRAQFTTEENIMLAKWSIDRFRMLGAELNSNFWFRQGGYMFLAESEEERGRVPFEVRPRHPHPGQRPGARYRSLFRDQQVHRRLLQKRGRNTVPISAPLRIRGTAEEVRSQDRDA